MPKSKSTTTAKIPEIIIAEQDRSAFDEIEEDANKNTKIDNLVSPF